MICPSCRAGGEIARESREGTRPNANLGDVMLAHANCTNPATCSCQHVVDLGDGPIVPALSPVNKRPGYFT